MMIVSVAVAALLLWQPTLDPGEPFMRTWRKVREYTLVPSEPVVIDAPDPAIVPDGTPATAVNMGIIFFGGHGQGATWQTFPNGDRYVHCPVDTDAMMIFERAGLVGRRTFSGYEVGVQYNRVPGVALSNNQHRAISIMGPSQLWYRHRLQPGDERGVLMQPSVFADLLVGNMETRPINDRIAFNEVIRWGAYFNKRDGQMGFTLDGAEVSHLAGSDVVMVPNIGQMATFNPIADPSIQTNICYPIKLWSDESLYNELVPDRSSGEYGPKARWLDQMSMDFGPFEQVGGGLTVVASGYGTGGVQPRRYRMVSSGVGSASIALRKGHELGGLTAVSGRAALTFPSIYAPQGGTVSIRVGESVDGDLIDLTFNGSVGTPNTREIQINGVSTGLNYRESRRYKLTIVFDEIAQQSSLRLEDLTTVGPTGLRLFAAKWSGVGRIPEVNKMSITVSGAGVEVEGPYNPSSDDILIASSYVNAPAASTLPTMSTATHIGLYLDLSPNPGSRLNTGINSVTPFGRSGHKVTNMDEAMGQYEPFSQMKGARIVAIETTVNDGAVVDVVVDEMKLMIDACAANDVRMLYASSIPLRAGGAHDYSDEYRNNQRLISKQVILYMAAKNRPDLFSVADIAAQFTDFEAQVAFFGGDDVHFIASGDELFASLLLSLEVPVGKK